MKRKALIVLGVIVAVLVVAAIALPLLVDADSFRPRIEAQLQSALGRTVKIGHLSLSLLAGGVSAADISIADDPAFSAQPFLQAKSLDVSVDLPALIFSRALHVQGITLVEPQVALLHNAAGKWNFSSLGTKQEASVKNSAPQSSADLSVQKLRVVKGRIAAGVAGGKQQVYDDVTLDASNISYASAIPFVLEANTPGGGRMKVEGTAGPLDRADAARSPLKAAVTMTNVDLGKTGFLGADSGIAGLLDYSGTMTSDGKTLHSEGTAKTQQLRLVKAGSPARQPVSVSYKSDYDMKRETGTLTAGEVHTGNSVARVSGNYDAHGKDTIVHMKVNGQNLPIQDVAGLLPAMGVALPAGSSLQSGSVTANLAMDGPVERLVTTGTLDLANVKLAGFNIGSKMASIATLAGIRTGNDTTIQAMSSKLRIAPEGIRADALNLVVAELGTVTGSGTMSSSNALNFKMAAKLNSNASLVGGLTKIAGLGQANKPIPFLIQGTTQNPVFVPDVGGMMSNTVTAPVQGVQGLGDTLGGLFGRKKKQ
ncbi:MAG: AsmA family protein [Terriglobales bacterium]